MTSCVFTLDYEIYGNGSGSLRELVLEPTQRLAEIFAEYGAPFVVFTEAVEFSRIEQAQSDPDSSAVRKQLRDLRAAGHEIALHLHPWWANAQFEGGRWHMDWSERNLGILDAGRIECIVSDAIGYLREALRDPKFLPFAFRSGLWAMQPSHAIADVLSRHGICVDSSVFAGGRIESLGLDYRRAPRKCSHWRFSRDVAIPDSEGALSEVPIYTQMVPFWQMLGSKRLKLQKKAQAPGYGTLLPRSWKDFARLRYPRKLDFCRMTFDEMRDSMQSVLKQAQSRPDELTTVVAIGHSKDFTDPGATERFLAYLRKQSVTVSTFSKVFSKELELVC